METIRKPAVAGMFYPSSPTVLSNTIDELLNNNFTKEQFSGITGIVAPHAGYVYSGGTAAYAYNTVKDKIIDTVIILSPSHREYFNGLSIYSGDSYSTPLGTVKINKDIREILTQKSKIIYSSVEGHRNEHAVEVQIPFLQTIYNDFTIVPIVLGDQNRKYMFELAERLAEVITDTTLIVASSDLSHFYNKNKAELLDKIVEDKITKFDYNGLQNDLDKGYCEACGGGTIVTLLKLSELINKKKSQVLKRTTSGDITGDYSEVVGYLSAVVFQE